MESTETPAKPKLTLTLNKVNLGALKQKIQEAVPKPPKVKKLTLEVEEYKKILAIVRRRFSRAFPPCKRDMRLLKNGIHKDLVEELKPEFDAKAVARFLYVYTRKARYILHAKKSTPRYNLYGRIAGHMSKKEEVHYAKMRAKEDSKKPQEYKK